MSKTISWHKEKLMARFTPREKSFNVLIIQHAVGIRDYTTLVVIQSKKANFFGDYQVYAVKPLIKNSPYNVEPTVVHKALEELINEGKLHSNISFKEFTMQVALGTAPQRKITREI